MLFTTLKYAAFFAVAFLGSWLLGLVPARGQDGAAAPSWPRTALLLLVSFGLYAVFLGRFQPGLFAGPGAIALGAAALIAVLALALIAPRLAAARGEGRAPGSFNPWPRTVFLLVLSYGFYAAWDYRYLPLIFGSSTVDFFLARAIARLESPRARKALLLVTVVLNLGFLGFFKYWNFALENLHALQAMITGAPVDAGTAFKVLLPPVGISFFTFESMSYVIDVYRGELEPHRSYLRYLLFVSFFPHLVAGPIVRPRDLLPQFERAPRLSREDAGEALFLIAVGLIKKLVISDQLAQSLVERVFERPANFSGLEVLAGVYGYAVQIYCDFSGYSDIAIGSALLLGVRFPKNFDAPYQSVNLQDFWRRWHISLSTWLRDYLYIPLGGSRGGPFKTYRNLFLTMLLGGLWHGASWNFVLWGALHGAGLGVTRAWQRAREVSGVDARPSRIGQLIGVVLTFHFVCFAWIFFRAQTFGQAVAVLKQIATLTTFHPNLPPLLVALLLVGLAVQGVPAGLYARARRGFTALPAPAQGALLFAVAVVLHEAASTAAVPFVYFQF